MSKLKSPAWAYFEVLESDGTKVKCIFSNCNKIISRGGVGKKASTSPLLFHLKTYHKQEYDEIQIKRENSVGGSPSTKQNHARSKIKDDPIQEARSASAPKPSSRQPGERSEEIFGAFVASELKEITDRAILQETKWKIQMSLMEGIRKQNISMLANVSRSSPSNNDPQANLTRTTCFDSADVLAPETLYLRMPSPIIVCESGDSDGDSAETHGS